MKKKRIYKKKVKIQPQPQTLEHNHDSSVSILYNPYYYNDINYFKMYI